MLELKNIFVKNILKNLNVKIEKGEIILIIGGNGAGKTTLFNVISGEIKPESGEIFINDRDIKNISQHKRTLLISSVLQDPKYGTIENMTILENLNIAYMRGKKRSIVIPRNLKNYFKNRLQILEMNLENRLTDYVKNLSGGQRQALSLIMATLSEYEILLLDEITAALDPRTSDLVMELTDRLVKTDKKTCLLITHNTKYIKKFGDRTMIMENGRLRDV